MNTLATLTLSLTLALAVLPVAISAPAVPAPVAAALTAALTVPGARVVAHDYRPSPAGCEANDASVPAAIAASGRYAVKIAGAGCAGWATVRLDVYAPVAVTTHALAAGDSLDGAVDLSERLLIAGHPSFVPPPGAAAARALPAGRTLNRGDVKDAAAALAAGTAVRVVVRSGLVVLEQTGRFVPCGSGRACAVLPSGKHVEGRLEDGRVVVEVP